MSLDDVPLQRRISGRAAAAAAVLAAAALLVALLHVVFGGAARGSPVSPLPERTVPTVASSEPPPVATSSWPVSGASAPTVPARVLVDVVGRVKRPGLVTLPAGARVADALRAAGGPATGADVAAVNLARPLVDGEQIVVPRHGQRLPAAAVPSGGAAATAAVDLNTATAAELDALPGVGPVLAGRILAWRAAHGRFSTVDELGEVSGIGDATLARLRPLVRA